MQGKFRFEALITAKNLHTDVRFAHDDIFVYQWSYFTVLQRSVEPSSSSVFGTETGKA